MNIKNVNRDLRRHCERIRRGCTECNRCARDCAFLQEYGNPLKIAASCSYGSLEDLNRAYQCNLCNLCTAVCPEDLDPASLFLEMRRETVRRGQRLSHKHKILLSYEKRGKANRYRFDAVTPETTRVFFPGCTLPGTRPGRTWEIFEYLREEVPSTGMILDCCSKPSHDLGLEELFTDSFYAMQKRLSGSNIKEVIVACPNCYNVFTRYATELKVTSIYEILARSDMPIMTPPANEMYLHYPCAVRFERRVNESIDRIIKKTDLQIAVQKNTPEKTYCCGEGGGVYLFRKDLAAGWVEKNLKEAEKRPIVTACAGCANMFGAETETRHLLDLIFDPEKAAGGHAPVSKTPFTYLNRMILKQKLKRFFKKAMLHR